MFVHDTTAASCVSSPFIELLIVSKEIRARHANCGETITQQVACGKDATPSRPVVRC